jgi:deazaflavin-dependent oxidoreductase (nitroreductase family)
VGGAGRGQTGRVPLEGEYAPSSEQWVREEVEHYERTAGTAWGGRPVVVLTSRGATSGTLRKTPLMRVEYQGAYAAVASMAGAGRHPAWYYNLLAEPRVELQDGPRRQDMTARELSGPERAAWWSRACTVFPSYADYQSRTRRRIPVFLLEPPAQEVRASS